MVELIEIPRLGEALYGDYEINGIVCNGNSLIEIAGEGESFREAMLEISAIRSLLDSEPNVSKNVFQSNLKSALIDINVVSIIDMTLNDIIKEHTNLKINHREMSLEELQNRIEKNNDFEYDKNFSIKEEREVIIGDLN